MELHKFHFTWTELHMITTYASCLFKNLNVVFLKMMKKKYYDEKKNEELKSKHLGNAFKKKKYRRRMNE